MYSVPGDSSVVPWQVLSSRAVEVETHGRGPCSAGMLPVSLVGGVWGEERGLGRDSWCVVWALE